MKFEHKHRPHSLADIIFADAHVAGVIHDTASGVRDNHIILDVIPKDYVMTSGYQSGQPYHLLIKSRHRPATMPGGMRCCDVINAAHPALYPTPDEYQN